MRIFTQVSEVPHPRAVVWNWHLRAGALQRLTPPWQRVRIRSHQGIADGARAEFELRQGPLRLRWTAVHDRCVAGASFRDVQERGPFAAWFHEHGFADVPGGCRCSDTIAWEPAWWMPAGRVARELERAFAWRHRRLREDLDRHIAAAIPAMAIAVSGTGGLVGSALAAFLTSGGHRVVPIRRGVAPGDGHIAWDGGDGIDAARLRACDAVVHLAGAGIADRRWSAARRAEIRDSRVRGTAAIATALAADPGRVRTLVAASATGFYGDRGEQRLDEGAAPEEDFLASVCRDWEAACDPCRDSVRTVNLRLGVVVSASGGALARMLPAARLGLAGALGDGKQWWSWIALDDLLHVILHILATPGLSGPVNAVAPQPLRQADFTRALAAAVGRPALGPPAPAWALRLAVGGLADAALLASARVLPMRLATSGFRWQHPDPVAAMRWEFGVKLRGS